jgi:hypothetical protein
LIYLVAGGFSGFASNVTLRRIIEMLRRLRMTGRRYFRSKLGASA